MPDGWKNTVHRLRRWRRLRANPLLAHAGHGGFIRFSTHTVRGLLCLGCEQFIPDDR